MRGWRPAAALLLLAVACTGGAEPEPSPAARPGDPATASASPTEPTAVTADAREWTDEVCAAVADWADDVRAVPARIQGGISGASGPEAVRGVLVEVLEETNSRNEALLAELRQAGAPDVPGGQSVARELESVFGEGLDVLDDAAARARDLPVDDPQDFAAGVTTLSVQLLGAGSSLAERADRLEGLFDTPELRAAFAASGECRRLEG